MVKEVPATATQCPICGYNMKPELVRRPPSRRQLEHPGYYTRVICLNPTCGYVVEGDIPVPRSAGG